MRPSIVVEVGSEPPGARQQPDRQVGAGAPEVERVEATLRHPVGARDDRLHPLAPRLDRVVAVEPEHIDHLVPELVERFLRLELGMHALRPAGVGRRPGSPVRRALVDDPRHRGDVRQQVATRASGVEALEDRRARARQRDPGGVLVREPLHPLLDPGRHEVERALVGVLEPLPLDELVPPEDVDVLRAPLVAGARHGVGDVLHPVVRGDAQDLARLDVRAEADEEIGEAVHVLRTVAHGRRQTTLPRSSDSALAESERARSLKAAASRPRHVAQSLAEVRPL